MDVLQFTGKFYTPARHADRELKDTTLLERGGIRQFPDLGGYEAEAPGWDFIRFMSLRIRSILGILLQMTVLVHVVTEKQRSEIPKIVLCCLIYLFLLRLNSWNGLGGGGVSMRSFLGPKLIRYYPRLRVLDKEYSLSSFDFFIPYY